MFRDLRIGWRLLIKEPVYSTVAILGLALGFATCFLIMAFVKFSLSYNATVPAVSQIYLVKARPNLMTAPQWYDSVSISFKQAIADSGMKVSASVFIPLTASGRVGTQLQSLDLAAVDASFPLVFGIATVEGDLSAALTSPDGIALTVQTAERLFSARDVLGKSLLIAGKAYQVRAILANPPAATSIFYGALVGLDAPAIPLQERQMGLTGRIYLKVDASVAPAVVTEFLQSVSDRSPMATNLPTALRDRLAGRKLSDIGLIRLTDVYFDRDLANNQGTEKHGDRGVMYGLAVIAMLVLLLASINYVNLATIRSVARQREIGTYKVLGASASHIAVKFLMESILVALLAAALGLMVAQVLLPIVSTVLDRPLPSLMNTTDILTAALIGIAVGAASGFYPGWGAMRVHTARSLAGRAGSETRSAGLVRRALTILQFAVAMSLSGLTLAITWQTYYVTHRSPGFDAAPLLVVDLPSQLTDAASRAYRDELLRENGVVDIGVSNYVVGRELVALSTSFKGIGAAESASILHKVNPQFFKVYGIAPVAGRFFDPKLDVPEHASVVVINAAAARNFGFSTAESAVGQFLSRRKPGGGMMDLQIIGVAPDLSYHDLRESVKPMVYMFSSAASTLTVRATHANTAEVESRARELWQKHFPNDIAPISRMSTMITKVYADDVRIVKMLIAATVISLVISAFGIYVLSAYNVQRRVREIALRKLYGAAPGDIARLFWKDLLALISISALIGLPVAALAINRYMATFIERAPFGMIPLILGLLATSLIAFLSAWQQSLASTRISPAAAFRM